EAPAGGAGSGRVGDGEGGRGHGLDGAPRLGVGGADRVGRFGADGEFVEQGGVERVSGVALRGGAAGVDLGDAAERGLGPPVVREGGAVLREGGGGVVRGEERIAGGDTLGGRGAADLAVGPVEFGE